MQNKLIQFLEAISSDKRLKILDWLRDPARHFPPQKDGDLVRDGVCGVLIARKLDISPSTASRHLNQLTDAGLLKAKRIKQWTFYSRDEKAIEKMKTLIERSV